MGKPKNCINCGAPITGKRCEYCGTVYSDDPLRVEFGQDECTGVLSFGGKQYNVYLSDLDISDGGYVARDILGNLKRYGRMIHKFTLIEL